MRSKLIEIEGSAEHGVQREEAMSRHARLVLAAVSKTPVYKSVSSDCSKRPVPKSAPAALRKKKLTVTTNMKLCLRSINEAIWCKHLAV